MDRVYFDDKCVVCYSGISFLRKQNPKCKIEFLEISKLNNPSPYSKAIIGEFKQKKYKGFDTIIVMLKELGYKKISLFITTPILKQIFTLIYYIFASFIRPLLPKRDI